MNAFLTGQIIYKDNKKRVEYLKELYLSLKESLPKFNIPLSLIAEDDFNLL